MGKRAVHNQGILLEFCMWEESGFTYYGGGFYLTMGKRAAQEQTESGISDLGVIPGGIYGVGDKIAPVLEGKCARDWNDDKRLNMVLLYLISFLFSYVIKTREPQQPNTNKCPTPYYIYIYTVYTIQISCDT